MRKLLLFLLITVSYLSVQAQTTPVNPVQLNQNTIYREPSTGRRWGYNGITYQWYVIPDSTYIRKYAGGDTLSVDGNFFFGGTITNHILHLADTIKKGNGWYIQSTNTGLPTLTLLTSNTNPLSPPVFDIKNISGSSVFRVGFTGIAFGMGMSYISGGMFSSVKLSSTGTIITSYKANSDTVLNVVNSNPSSTGATLALGDSTSTGVKYRFVVPHGALSNSVSVGDSTLVIGTNNVIKKAALGGGGNNIYNSNGRQTDALRTDTLGGNTLQFVAKSGSDSTAMSIAASGGVNIFGANATDTSSFGFNATNYFASINKGTQSNSISIVDSETGLTSTNGSRVAVFGTLSDTFPSAYMQYQSDTGTFKRIRVSGAEIGVTVLDNVNQVGLIGTQVFPLSGSAAQYAQYGKVDSLIAVGGGGTTTHPLTINNSGSGTASGSLFDGSSAKTISYNSIGAQPLLVSGTNLKTINSVSLLGSSNILLQTPLVAGTDYLTPTGSAALLTSFPTLNQNTTGTASNLSGTPSLPNGTTATTQTGSDNTTKLATDAFVQTAIAGLTSIYQPLEDQRLSTTNSPSFVKENLTGTAGNGYLDLGTQSASPASVTNHLRIYSDSLNRISWKNSLYRRTIQVPYPSDYTIRMPYRITGTTLEDSTHAIATYVPLTRTLTINGTPFDLSVNRSWTVTAANLSAQSITSGTTATVTGGNYRVYIDPSSTIASFTLTLPASPSDGDIVKVYFGGTLTSGTIVTALVVSPNSGQTILDNTPPVNATADNVLIYTYRTSNTKWNREKP